MFRRRPFAAALTLALVAPVTAITPTSAGAAPTPSVAQAARTPQAKHLPRPARDPIAKRAHDPHTVLVKFAESASGPARDGAVQSRGGRMAAAVPGTGFVTVRTPGPADELASRLSADPSVAEVTLDYVREASASPSDYFYATTREQEYLKTVRIPTAWDRSKGSLSQVVAVLDTGVNGKHPDLTGRTVAGFNAITNVGIAAGAASDDKGHGSMVAGIIAAETNNSEGIAGVAWNARVMPVKVLNSLGKGTDSDIIQGIKWAADHGARIINMSLGGPDDSPALHDAVKYAVGKGAVVIAAAGNSGSDRPEYPAAYSEAIAVAATDNAGKLTYFSTHGSWVDVAAPGWSILSTERGSDYYFGDGTSFSAPIVSGIAVLLRSKTASMTPAQIAARLRSTARDAGPRGADPFFGAGIVDATNALGGGWTGDFGQPSTGVNEPNDVPSRATGLTGSATGTVGIEGDVDWYRYTSAAERATSVTVTPPLLDLDLPQNVDPAFAVYDQDLKLVGAVDKAAEGAPETLSLRMGAGTYYVAVSNYNGSRVPDRDYTLSVQPDTGKGVFDPAQPVAGLTASYGPLAVGDINGDGRADVVAGLDYSSPGQLHVIKQAAAGGLGSPGAYQTSEASLVRNVVVADLDGDTLSDVVVSTEVGIQVFRQTPEHLLTGPTVVPDTAQTGFVQVADIDGDGRQDLVQSTPSSIAVLHGQADGTWLPEVLDDMGTEEIEIGDLDGDARPDIALTRGASPRILHNRASGWTTTDHPMNASWGASGIEVADVNGDGRADLAAVTPANYPNSELFVWRQGADGSLGAATRSPMTDMPQPLEAADVTGDGRLDLVSAHGSYNVVTVRAQQAGGTLADPSTSFVQSPSHFSRTGLGLADLTGDGRVDAVVPSYAGLMLLRNAGGATRGGAQEWVRSAWPADFGTGSPVTTTPTVTFVRDVVPSTVTASTVGILNGRTGARVPATVTYDQTKRTATIKPTAKLYDNAPYRLTVSGVKDGASATMTLPYSSTFRTVDLAPAAVGAFRATGALRAATLAWTAPAANDLDRYIVRMAMGSTPPANVTAGAGVYSGTAATATVNLAQGTTYSFKIWAKDRSGKYGAASSVRLVGTAVTITSTATSLTKGRPVTVSGKLTRRDTGGAVAGVPVQLYWRKVGATTWNLTSTRTSSATGAVSFAHSPTASVDYMWVYRGSTAFVGSSSALRRVTVR